MGKMVSHVPASYAYATLQQQKNVYLIDVRTAREQIEFGIPKTAHASNPLITLPLTNEDKTIINHDFLTALQNGVQGKIQKNDQIFFICKSGQRSEMACNVAIECGYINVHNVSTGFCGSHPDSWKASSLPWELIKGN